MVTEDTELLRAERDALIERDVDAWLTWAKDDASKYRNFEGSISWRITKPIRGAGVFVRKVKSDGLVEAVRLVVVVLRRGIARK